MSARILTLEISDLVTRACEISYETKNPTIYKSIVFDNPEYSVEDGFITDRGAYAAAMRDNLAAAKIKCKDVVFVLTSSKVISRETVIPQLKDELISELIENEREEYFPMDTSDHVFTYEIMEKLPATKQLRILIFAAPEVLVKNYQVLAKENDLKTVAIDYNGNTVYQFLKNSKQDMDLFIQVNEKTSMFTIIENKTLALQRNMNFGTHTLTGALSASGLYGRDIEESAALVKLSDKDLLFHSFADMEMSKDVASKEPELQRTKENLTEAVRPFLANISRVLEYYNTKNREAKVGTIYLGGVGAKIMGLKELIASEFNGIEIVTADISKAANFAKSNHVGVERNTEFIGCIGASTKSINFFKIDRRKKMAGTMVFCLVALTVVILSSAVIIMNGKAKYDAALMNQSLLMAEEAQLEAQSTSQLEKDSEQAAAELSEIVMMDASTRSINESINDILECLEKNSIADMSVQSLSSTEAGLNFSVVLHSKEEVGQFLLQMQSIPYFKSVSIGGVSESKDGNGRTDIYLSVSCEYAAVGEEAEQ